MEMRIMEVEAVKVLPLTMVRLVTASPTQAVPFHATIALRYSMVALLEWMNLVSENLFPILCVLLIKPMDLTEQLDTVLFHNFFLLTEEAEPEDSGDYWQIKIE